MRPLIHRLFCLIPAPLRRHLRSSARGDGGHGEVATLAWPLAVGMLSFTLMGVVDTLLMGRVGTEAQAGVGLATTLAFTAVAFFRGLTMGPQALVAASDGRGDDHRVRRAAGAGIAIGLVSGLLAGGALWLAATPLLGAVLDGAPSGEIIGAHASVYLEVRALGVPFTLLGMGLLSGLLGLGDTRTRMWVSLAGNVLNAALDVLLIGGAGPIPAMGAAGAAWATVGSSALMCVLYGWRFAHRIGVPSLPGLAVLRDSVVVGLPAGAQGLLSVVAFAVINVLLARVGPVHLAASEIVLQIASVSFLPGYGLGEAGGILVGRYLGAGTPRTAARALRSARAIAVLVMGLCSLAFLVGGHHLAACFTQDPEVVALAARLLLFAAAFQVLDAVALVHLCALRSAGDTRYTLALTTVAAWGVTVPLTWALGVGLGWGAEGAWLGLTLEIAVLAALTGRRVRGLRTGHVGRLDLLLG